MNDRRPRSDEGQRSLAGRWRPGGRAQAAGAAVAVLAVGAIAFALVRFGGDSPGLEPAAADQPAIEEQIDAARKPGPDETPVPGTPITTSGPWWHIPYENAYRMKPRYEQVINGIKVGPDTAIDTPDLCKAGEASYIDASRAGSSDVSFKPRYLIAGATLSQHTAIECRGRILVNEAEYGFPPADDAIERIAGGESWFTVPHGGRFSIARAVRDVPASKSDIAAEHWEPATIAGLPAAVGRPILDEGLGNAEILVWDERTSVLTRVTTTNVSLKEALQITEGLFK